MPGRGIPRSIRVVDYDSDWPRIFLDLRDWIWLSVSDVATAIEHVGSTAVPGMAAKPVIDIDVVITSRSSLASVLPRVERLGYQYRGDLGIEDREAFKAPENQPAHRLYVCVQDSLALKNHVAVRDYLRTHLAEAEAYSALKKELAKRFAIKRERYVNAKTEFILSILKRCQFSDTELDSIKRSNQT